MRVKKQFDRLDLATIDDGRFRDALTDEIGQVMADFEAEAERRSAYKRPRYEAAKLKATVSARLSVDYDPKTGAVEVGWAITGVRRPGASGSVPAVMLRGALHVERGEQGELFGRTPDQIGGVTEASLRDSYRTGGGRLAGEGRIVVLRDDDPDDDPDDDQGGG